MGYGIRHNILCHLPMAFLLSLTLSYALALTELSVLVDTVSSSFYANCRVLHGSVLFPTLLFLTSLLDFYIGDFTMHASSHFDFHPFSVTLEETCTQQIYSTVSDLKPIPAWGIQNSRQFNSNMTGFQINLLK